MTKMKGAVNGEVHLFVRRGAAACVGHNRVGGCADALLVDGNAGAVLRLAHEYAVHIIRHGVEIADAGVKHVRDPQGLEPGDEVGLAGYVKLGTE